MTDEELLAHLGALHAIIRTSHEGLNRQIAQGYDILEEEDLERFHRERPLLHSLARTTLGLEAVLHGCSLGYGSWTEAEDLDDEPAVWATFEAHLRSTETHLRAARASLNYLQPRAAETTLEAKAAILRGMEMLVDGLLSGLEEMGLGAVEVHGGDRF